MSFQWAEPTISLIRHADTCVSFNCWIDVEEIIHQLILNTLSKHTDHKKSHRNRIFLYLQAGQSWMLGGRDRWIGHDCAQFFL